MLRVVFISLLVFMFSTVWCGSFHNYVCCSTAWLWGRGWRRYLSLTAERDTDREVHVLSRCPDLKFMQPKCVKLNRYEERGKSGMKAEWYERARWKCWWERRRLWQMERQMKTSEIKTEWVWEMLRADCCHVEQFSSEDSVELKLFMESSLALWNFNS